MKRITYFLVLLALIVPASLLFKVESAAALPPPASPFVGEWKAVSPLAIPDARLTVRGRHVMVVHLEDPFDRLFCNSTASDIEGVRAFGVGFLTGPRTMEVRFLWRCSDGSFGLGTALFNLSPSSDDEMVDSSGHFWARVP